MKYTILHISDLHKGKDCHFDDLLDSLLVDRDEYVQKGIKSPEIIVVSGDLAEGASGDNAADEIRKQYEDVERLMVKGSSTSQASARHLVACKARRAMTWLIPILV